METKKNIRIGIFILMILISITGIYAFDYNEDDDGNPFLESEFNVKVPQMSIRDLFILQPSSEPLNPEIGMIYFDASSKRLKLYDGDGWYAIALEKVSTVSKQQVKEKVEKKGEIKVCDSSVECGEWGDCINNYQSMICVTVDATCNKYEDTETRDCVSDFKLESSAKDSHDVGESSDTGGTKETTEEAEETTEESTEESGETETETEEVKTEETEAEEVEEGVEEVEEAEVESELEVEEPAPEPEPEPEPAEEVPEELFDITFDLEESSLSKSDKLVVWITLQNFGKKYVPARLIYTITDEAGKEVYKKFEEIRVYTDESIIKSFEDLILEEGGYVLSLRVEYAGIVEEFSNDFSVESGLLSAIKRFFSGLF